MAFEAAGGAGSVTVTAQAGCAWTAANSNAWITITQGTSGSGNGAVNYTVEANSGAASRTGTLTIAGQPFTITQAAASAGMLQFSQSNYTVSETGGVATLTVTRAGGQAGAVGVSYATGGGSATVGQDYTAVSGTLSWADGETGPRTFSVPILDDSNVEGNETVNVSLSNPTGGATLGTPSAAVLTITDNDACAYSLSTTNAAFDAAGGVSNVTVWALSGCAWTVVNSNAWITIASGSSGNGTDTVSYVVGPHTGLSLRTGTLMVGDAMHTVTQRAPCGTLQFSQSNYTVSETGGVATLTVTRLGGQAGAVGVSYATGGGSATEGQDYTAVSGTLSWADGETGSKTLSVPILDDGDVEGSETVNVSLSSPTGGATLGTPSVAVLTITDNDACAYSLSTTNAAFDAAGGVSNVTVWALSGCAWTVVNSNAWITIASGSSGSGDGTVNYTVATNTDTATRTGTLTIAGQPFTITQTAPRDTLQFSQTSFTVLRGCD